MEIKIMPSILVHNKKELKDRIQRVQGLVDVIQIDIADNKFVPNTTVQLADIKEVLEELKPETKFEAHLMVEDPENYIEAYSEFCETLIFHYEAAKARTLELIKKIKSLGRKAGIAINPDTELEEVKDLLSKADELLFMTVYPGFSGQRFIPEALPKIQEVRKLFPEIDIEVDGGLKVGTACLAAKAGANIICGASAIYNPKDTKKAVQDLLEDAKEGLRLRMSG